MAQTTWFTVRGSLTSPDQTMAEAGDMQEAPSDPAWSISEKLLTVALGETVPANGHTAALPRVSPQISRSPRLSSNPGVSFTDHPGEVCVSSPVPSPHSVTATIRQETGRALA